MSIHTLLFVTALCYITFEENWENFKQLIFPNSQNFTFKILLEFAMKWYILLIKGVNLLIFDLLDRRQPGPVKSVLVVIIGWLVDWLVRQFSGAWRIFLIFCMKLVGCKGRKVIESGFWKKNLDLEIFMKRSPN